MIDRGQLDRALIELGHVVEEDPTDTRTWLKIAELQLKMGDHAGAAQIYGRAGELYAERGLAKQAAAVYRNVLKLAPGNAKAHLRLGGLYKQLGMAAEAVQELDLAASTLAKSGANGDAAAALRQAAALDPKDVALRVKLAEAASAAGRADEAAAELGRVADQMKAEGRDDEAMRVLERLLFLRPDDIARARELAEAYLAKGTPRLALPKLQACLKAAPQDPRMLTLLAHAFEQLGQTDKAHAVHEELAHLGLGPLARRESAVVLAPGRAAAPSTEARPRMPPPLPGARAPQARGGASDGDPRGVAGPAPVGPGSGRVSAPPSGGGGSGRVTAAASERAGSGRVAAAVGAAEFASASGRVEIPVSDASGASGSPLARFLAESEIFAKYGMFDRAAEHLTRALGIDPDSRPVREMLAGVLEQMGRGAEAARHLRVLVKQLARTEPVEARRLAERATVLEPPRGPARTSGVISAPDDEPRASRPTPSPGPSLSPPTPSPGPSLSRSAAPLAPMSAATSWDGLPNIDIDPNADIVTPPPAPLALEPDDDDAGFEVSVTSGDVLVIDEVSATSHIIQEDDDVEYEAEVESEAYADADAYAESEAYADAEIHEQEEQEEQEEHEEPGSDQITPPPTLATEARRTQGSRPSAFEDQLGTELEQVSFYLSQGLPDEARALLADLERRHPHDGRIVARLRDIEAYEMRQAEAEAAMRARDRAAMDVGNSPARGGSAGGGTGAIAPRAFVEAGGAPDVSTHVDLAIAYKEMGLHDAAIAELAVVVTDPAREVMGLTMMGECYEAKGSFTDAVIRYKEALNQTPITQDETMQLYFLLGNAFDRLGDASEALYFFEKVARRDPAFRDVNQRIVALKPKLVRTVAP